MLLGVMSDTHLSRADGRLEALLRGPLGRAEVLVHAGDYASADVVDHLEYVDERPFYGVAGNIDPASVAHRLPAQRTFELAGVRVGLTHGFGAPHAVADRVVERFDPLPRLLVFGHSHQPLLQWRGATLLVNPGSAFDRRSAPACTVALVRLEKETLDAEIVEVGR